MNEELRGDLSGLPDHGLVVVGFSGGADSTALVHWLAGRVDRSRLVLAHVNHLLRGGEAERDEAAAEAFAKSLGLCFKAFRADVGALARERGLGLEECGRTVRYEFFQSLAPGEHDRILTAHNLNDNAETMLWNLCRGTGLSGLCGIPYNRGKILRPFLKVGRDEIENYCEVHGLSYVTDSTNLSGNFSRNRIRREVLPVLEELNPQTVKAMSQTAELLSRDRDFLREEADRLLEKAGRPHGLDTGILGAAPAAVSGLSIRLWLERQGFFHTEKKHFDMIMESLSTGGAVPIPGGGLVRCSGGLLTIDPQEAPEPFCMEVSLGETVLPGGRTLVLEKKEVFFGKSTQKIHNLDFKNALDCDIITAISLTEKEPGPYRLTARTRRVGDRFSPAGRGLSKPLKQIFQELGVPPALRENAVLLECGGKVAYCQGAGVSEEFRVRETTKEAIFVSLRENAGKAEGNE